MTAAQMVLELQRNVFGITVRWVWDWNPNGPRIPTQMGPRILNKWVWDHSPECCSLDLQSRWVWDCKSGGLGLQPKSIQDCKQKDLELESRWT